MLQVSELDPCLRQLSREEDVSWSGQTQGLNVRTPDGHVLAWKVADALAFTEQIALEALLDLVAKLQAAGARWASRVH